MPLWILVIFFVNESYFKKINNPYLIYKTPDQFSFRKELFHHYLHSEFKRIKNTFNSKTIYTGGSIPVINLYFESHKLKNLLRKLPESGKKAFIEGHLTLGDKDYKIKAKIRGGSYWHWKNNHKSWRIKILNGKKVFELTSFDLVNPKLLFSTSETLAHNFSRKLKLWNVENRIVRVNINNKYVGHSYTLSRLDLEFLRQNRKVSGSIYGIDTDSELIENDDFYTTAKAWNTGVGWLDLVQLDHNLNRKKELIELGKVLRNKSLKSFYTFFQNHFDKEKMYTYMALDSILGIYHHSNSTSQRYYFNNKEGLFSPIPWDHLHWIQFNYVMISRNPIFDKIRLHPKLNYEYLEVLFKILNEDLSSSVILREMDKIYKTSYDAILNDPNKDAISVNSFLGTNPTETFSYDMSDYNKVISFNKLKIKIRHKFLKNFFQNLDVDLAIDYNGKYNLILITNHGSISPRLKNFSNQNIYIDSNNNQVFDKEDLLFQSKDENLLFSENEHTNHTIGDKYYLMHALIGKKTILTKKSQYLFFIPGKKINNLSLNYTNPLSKAKYKKKATKRNIHLNKLKMTTFKKTNLEGNKKKPVIIGPGIVEFKKTRVFDNDVTILKNTTIKLGADVSLVFKGRVFANGTKGEPIGIVPMVNGELFGSFVIRGNNSSRSILKNINIFDGSRTSHKLSEYSGVLSVYNSSDLLIENINLESSCNNCNGLNIYRSENFKIINASIKNFSKSLLKIQLSNGTLIDSNLNSTLMNGIKLEFSELSLINVKIGKFFNAGIEKYKSNIDLTNIELQNGGIGIKTDNRNDKYTFEYNSLSKEYHYE
ncbi:MAG: hypothetical protein ACJAS4_001570 [Bacteriovoracaceae bacterium]|jgi:hypothetical protein